MKAFVFGIPFKSTATSKFCFRFQTRATIESQLAGFKEKGVIFEILHQGIAPAMKVTTRSNAITL
jgi:hypothetical protein